MLSWISSSKLLRQQFIQHRVQLIREITSQSTWKYCPTAPNPADLIIRGIDAKAFISKQQYWNQGPSWLMKPTQERPSVTENQFQDRTENYTESQSIRVSFIRTCKGINAILTANVQGIAFFFPLETKRENHVPQNCRRNLLRPRNVFYVLTMTKIIPNIIKRRVYGDSPISVDIAPT